MSYELGCITLDGFSFCVYLFSFSGNAAFLYSLAVPCHSAGALSFEGMRTKQCQGIYFIVFTCLCPSRLLPVWNYTLRILHLTNHL